MSGRNGVFVQALYDFDYETVEGKKVWLKEGEELKLIRKTNGDWWQVIRNGEKRPFYAPANYVEEVSSLETRNRKSTSSLTDSGSDVNSNGSVSVSLSSLDALAPPTSSGSGSLNETLTAQLKESAKLLNNIVTQSVHNPKLPLRTNNGFSMKNRSQMLIKPCVNDFTVDSSPSINLSNSLPNPNVGVEQCKLVGRANYRYLNKEAIDISLNAIRESDNEHEKASRLISEDRWNNNNNNNSCANDNNNGESDRNKVVGGLTQDGNSRKNPTKPPRPRPPSPVYANFPLISSPNPPSPQIPRLPLRCLDGGWAEFEDFTGRKFYYNFSTEEKSWKPPRKLNIGESKPSRLSLSRCSNGSLSENEKSPEVQLLHCPTPTSITMPPGWIKSNDTKSGETCYINDKNKERWFTSADDRGRIYYYKENSVESFWQLPDISTELSKKNQGGLSTSLTTSSPSLLEGNVKRRSVSPGSPPNSITSRRRPLSMADRNCKTRSMVLVDSGYINDDIKDGKSYTLPKNIPTLNIVRLPGEVLRGILSKTKLSECGKKMRKNWTVSHTVLTDQSLYFFKDLKPTEINPNKAELRIELLGAAIEWAPEKSSRKHVFQITTITGTDLQILLQEDDNFTAKRWFEAISRSIRNLPSGFEYATMKLGDGMDDSRFHSINRKIVPKKIEKKGSVGSSAEDLDCSQIEKKSKIRDKLRNFFNRRPTLESLREKGIIKEELIFGCNLHTLCTREKTTIPKFVKRCIDAIEEKDMNADGLYRASGNLSQVQRIRFQINQDNWSVLSEEEDVHVLTGALKMFFRELKEPLFPIDTFGNFLDAIALPDRKGKLQAFDGLLESFPRPNYCTLKYLLEHLLRVTTFAEFNRMHVQNLAIVFGPTLMWSSTDPVSIALDVIHQNQIVEFLLLEFSTVFR